MKPATLAARTALMESVELRALPKVIAEWEHNRFSKIAAVDPNVENKVYVNVSPANVAEDLEWNSVFDINSITLPNRPTSGIAKARLSEPIKLQSGYRDKPQEARFYAASVRDLYKYWSSSQRSKLTPVATNEYDFPIPITMTLLYEQPVVSNKIVVGFDVSYARPKSYDIQITTNGTTWSTVATNAVPHSTTGQVVLWRASDGSQAWGTTAVYDGAVELRGIRLVVRSMNEAYSNLDVIQMGLRLENDLSDFVISYDRDFEISERSFIAPIGEASSNTATIDLSNIDLRFNNDNEDSVYYGLIDKKVKFTLDLSYNFLKNNGSADERYRELTMWADSWGGEDQDSVSVELKDSSVFLQEIDMPKVFWENMTIGAILWQIMDTVGMTNYNYNKDVLDTGQVIQYFWSKEGTVWDQISELSKGTQTAVWFDEYDVMQIKTRKSLFGPGKTVVWNLDAVKNSNKLPDIIDLSKQDDLVANHVTINWKPAEFQETKGYPVMETVWEPKEEDVVLRSSALTRDLLIADTSLFLKQSDAVHWPYESLVNIRGEILRYKGKEYLSNEIGGTKKLTVIFSQEEKDAIDAASNPDLWWSNSFTGRMVVAERNLGGSGLANHYVKPSTYSAKRTTWTNTGFNQINLNTQGGMYYKDGTVTLQPPFSATAVDYFLVQHETTIPSGPESTYGARFRFPEQNFPADGEARTGIWIDGDWGDTGYVFEISPTPVVENQNRSVRHEITMCRMPPNAWGQYVAGFDNPEGIKGFKAEIMPGVWYDFEVRESIASNGNVFFIAYLNGVVAGAWAVPANLRPPSIGANGIFVRGNCKAEFEYFYGMNHTGDVNDPSKPDVYSVPPDSSNFLDLVSGSFTSGFIQREWKYGAYWSLNHGPASEGSHWIQALRSRSSYFYDEFGPVVHEMREFDVEFSEDRAPVGSSYLYLSAQDQVVCTDYWSDAFGAKFTLVNAMRRDAIVKGEDSVTLGEDNKIAQKIFIYGRTLSHPDDANEIVKKDDDLIRRKGKISLEFDNRFIQTQKAAEDLAQWVIDLWGAGADELKAEVFGNPLLQLGDLVTVNFPVKGMLPGDHKYYIVSLKNSFSEGLTTDLILRRANV